MTQTNRKLIEKADLALSDLQSGNGYLADEQADAFIRLAIKESKLLQQITVTPMNSPRVERSKIRFAGRVLRPGTPAAALAASDRVKPDLSNYVLESKLFKAEARIDDVTLEDQIERDSFKDTIMATLSEAVGRDVEFVAIQGDTASATPLLAVLDGFLKQATSNIVDFSSAPLTKDGLRDMLKSLPEEFSVIERLKYYTARNARIDYRDSLSNRQTDMGDAMLMTQRDTTMYTDMPVESIPEWPDGGSTSVLLTDPRNLTVGFQRQIRFEMDRDVSAGVNIMVATVRFDVKIQEVSATSKGINVATT